MTGTRPAKPWRVYGDQPMPVTCRTERAARRLARKYKRLGIRATLYTAGGETGWELCEVIEAPAAAEATG